MKSGSLTPQPIIEAVAKILLRRWIRVLLILEPGNIGRLIVVDIDDLFDYMMTGCKEWLL